MEREVQKVTYTEEFRLVPDNGEIYHLVLTERALPATAKDRYGRTIRLKRGTKVLPIPKT